MLSLNMTDVAYCFSVNSIDSYVTEASPGNFALGYVEDEIFIVRFVGRADYNINKRLKEYIGEGTFNRFKFSYASSPLQAFEKECFNYHDFGENKKLHNICHPQRPSDTDWKCPVCDIYD